MHSSEGQREGGTDSFSPALWYFTRRMPGIRISRCGRAGCDLAKCVAVAAVVAATGDFRTVITYRIGLDRLTDLEFGARARVSFCALHRDLALSLAQVMMMYTLKLAVATQLLLWGVCHGAPKGVSGDSCVILSLQCELGSRSTAADVGRCFTYAAVLYTP